MVLIYYFTVMPAMPVEKQWAFNYKFDPESGRYSRQNKCYLRDCV